MNINNSPLQLGVDYTEKDGVYDRIDARTSVHLSERQIGAIASWLSENDVAGGNLSDKFRNAFALKPDTAA